ncbi:MAG: hypothetical protein CR982_09170 [Candidatus Cloacimonadota bacterium]|nr:MAG: hypothetical protein CR982_09170 [Candidatus Cloacimonadota bacterium]PIE77539.1 MAG: hypothetical protein CSA15_12485 [Candidatus Delongbacteria bacterium]
MNIKSRSCFSSKNKPLSEFYSKKEAIEGANYANLRYRQKLVPYRCERCGFWHLSPEDRNTDSITCLKCRDRYGNNKESYKSFQDAKRRSEIILKEKGVELKIYQCPHGNGWHFSRK